MALVSVVAVVLAFADRGTEASEAGGSGPLAAAIPEDDPLAPPPRLGLAIPRPVLLSSRAADVSLWAPVRRPLELRDGPVCARAYRRARVHVSTPEGTENLVLVTGRTRSEAGLWVPVRAAGATGWAPRGALGGYEKVDTQLLVDTRAVTRDARCAPTASFSEPASVSEPQTRRRRPARSTFATG